MKIKTLEEITSKIGSGATPRGGNSSYKSEGISLIRSQNIYDFSFSKNGLAFIDETQAKKLNNVTVIEGDILLNITGDSIARTCLVPKEILPARVNQHVSIVRCKPEFDSKFVNYYLINLKSYLMQICGVGGTRNALTKEAINKLEIRIPNSQKQIAKVLSDLDAKIEVNNKINQQLEAMAKTLYDYWFVQFDFPSPSSSSGQAGKPYKSSGGKMVFNEALKREIPEGWEVKSLAEISKIKAGGDKPKIISKVEMHDCKIPIYSNGVTNDGLYGYTNLAKIKMPSITVSARGTIGFSVLRKNPFVPIIRLISITPNSSFMIKFLHERVKLLEFENSGSVQKQLTVPQVSRLKIVVPSDDLLKKYHSITSPKIEIIDKNQKQNQKLSELRDWLLPMLMNGQVTVGEE